MRPAPILRCPTSELPIYPAGSPTARPEASMRVAPGREMSRSMLGRPRKAGGIARTGGSQPVAIKNEEQRRGKGHDALPWSRGLSLRPRRVLRDGGHRGHFAIQCGRFLPKGFDAEKLAHVLLENMHDDVVEVSQNPLPRSDSLPCAGIRSCSWCTAPSGRRRGSWHGGAKTP